ncbi:hypothetical protein HK105_208888 [Polyrhizophydium stewartii]|uniref:BZIP domain-containing protein n=1 Tax=Polyrhizophydium stewartii TaxID=2732419 RepID=A0ABR4MWL3_9FUNG
MSYQAESLPTQGPRIPALRAPILATPGLLHGQVSTSDRHVIAAAPQTNVYQARIDHDSLRPVDQSITAGPPKRSRSDSPDIQRSDERGPSGTHNHAQFVRSLLAYDRGPGFGGQAGAAGLPSEIAGTALSRQTPERVRGETAGPGRDGAAPAAEATVAVESTAFQGARELDASSEADPDERRRRLLERNRLAAHKCRQKKKAWMQQLEAQSHEVMQHNLHLQAVNKKLHDEVIELRRRMAAISEACTCGGGKRLYPATTMPKPPTHMPAANK